MTDQLKEETGQLRSYLWSFSKSGSPRNDESKNELSLFGLGVSDGVKKEFGEERNLVRGEELGLANGICCGILASRHKTKPIHRSDCKIFYNNATAYFYFYL